MKPVGKRGQKKRGNKGKGKKKLEFGGDIPMFQTPAGSLPGYEYDIRDKIANAIPFIGDLTKLGIVNGTNIASYQALKPWIAARKGIYRHANRKSTITPLSLPYEWGMNNIYTAYNNLHPSPTSDLGLNHAVDNERFGKVISGITDLNYNWSNNLSNTHLKNIDIADYNYNEAGKKAERQDEANSNVNLTLAEAKAGLINQIGSALNSFASNQNQRFANKLKNYNVGRDNLRKAALAKLKQNDPTNATQYDNDYLWQTLWAKQGGKTRTMEEQMAIDAARSNQKVIQKMNDSLAKMLIRLMK